MNTRKTNDYSPTATGSREQNEAFNARRQMMKVFASIPKRVEATRKSWRDRMLENAVGFK